MDISLTPNLAFAMDRIGKVDEMLDGASWFHDPSSLEDRIRALSTWGRDARLGHLTMLIDMAHWLGQVLDLPNDDDDSWDGEGEDPYNPVLFVAKEAATSMLASVLTEMQATFLVANKEQGR
jgi:hypothetical protein